MRKVLILLFFVLIISFGLIGYKQSVTVPDDVIKETNDHATIIQSQKS